MSFLKLGLQNRNCSQYTT